MTKNQREFQNELARLQRSISKLTSQHEFVQSYDLPTQPKRVTRKRIKQLQKLKGRHFVSQIDIETGEVIHEAEYQEIYKKTGRQKSYKKRAYDAEKARAYRESHRQQIREANKRYREANKDVIRERQRAYRQSHREEIRAKARVYREANKQRINADAKRRRRQKKLAQQSAQQPYIPTFDIYDEILMRFHEAKQEIIRERVPYSERKLECVDTLIGTLESNRAIMGADYMAYLKKHEETIAEQLHTLIYTSDQDGINSWLTSILMYLNPSGIEIPKSVLSDFAEETEGGW